MLLSLRGSSGSVRGGVNSLEYQLAKGSYARGRGGESLRPIPFCTGIVKLLTSQFINFLNDTSLQGARVQGRGGGKLAPHDASVHCHRYSSLMFAALRIRMTACRAIPFLSSSRHGSDRLQLRQACRQYAVAFLRELGGSFDGHEAPGDAQVAYQNCGISIHVLTCSFWRCWLL